MNEDSRMAIYISVLTLIFSCVGLGYGLLFFGWGSQTGFGKISVSPGLIVSAGLVIATINGLASNVLSEQLGKMTRHLSPILRFGIPLTVLLITLFLSILIALMSAN